MSSSDLPDFPRIILDDTTKKIRTKEGWCPQSRECSWWQWGCDVDDCIPPPVCDIETTQSSIQPNSSYFDNLINHLQGGYNQCINTSNCIADQLESAWAPSIVPFDGRPTGYHVEQRTNTHSACEATNYTVVVDRGTYGGPGTETDAAVTSGHLPLSLSDQCYLLHDLMYTMCPPNNNLVLLHADRVLLHNLKYVKDILGEDPRNTSYAENGFCVSTNSNPSTGISGWASSGLSDAVLSLAGNLLSGGVWSENGSCDTARFMTCLKIVKAMKVAKQNGVGIIDNFGFFDEMEIGGHYTYWGTLSNAAQYYSTYSSNSFDYFAFHMFYNNENGWNRQWFIDRVFNKLNSMTRDTTGNWGQFITNC